MDDLLTLTLDEKAPRADAQRNRRRLLATAQRLLAEGTFEAATMSEIAHLTGVGKGTLYRHFPDKAALCHALLDEAMREFQARTLTRLQRGEPPLDKLLWFLHEVVLYVTGHEALLLAAAEQGRQAEMLRHPAHLWWWQTIRGLLEQSHYRGDLVYAADTLYLMVDVQTLRFQRNLHGVTVERLIAGLQQVAERLVRGAG